MWDVGCKVYGVGCACCSALPTTLTPARQAPLLLTDAWKGGLLAHIMNDGPTAKIRDEIHALSFRLGVNGVRMRDESGGVAEAEGCV